MLITSTRTTLFECLQEVHDQVLRQHGLQCVATSKALQDERTLQAKSPAASYSTRRRAVFDSQEWMSVHMDMKITQVVVMYLDIEEILRPVSPPVVSVCKGILTSYSFLIFGTPRHYVMRK